MTGRPRKPDGLTAKALEVLRASRSPMKVEELAERMYDYGWETDSVDPLHTLVTHIRYLTQTGEVIRHGGGYYSIGRTDKGDKNA